MEKKARKDMKTPGYLFYKDIPRCRKYDRAGGSEKGHAAFRARGAVTSQDWK